MSINQRASLEVLGSYSLPFNGPGSVLRANNGIVFPYTPVINNQHSVEYSQFNLAHTNYQISSFSKSRPGNIQVTGNFSNQLQIEAQYTAGCIHFLRVVTKMHFGPNDDNAGTPPPLLSFSAYGPVNFNRIPVLVGGFTVNYPDDVDYINIQIGDAEVNLPIIVTISIDLIPHYPANRQNAFNLADFANGDQYKDGFI